MTDPRPLYSVHPDVVRAHRRAAELHLKTGRTLAQWIEILHAAGPVSETERRARLQSDHALPDAVASWIAQQAATPQPEPNDPDTYLHDAHRYVEHMLRGPRQATRPLYEHILNVALDMGPEVHACPVPAAVPLFRSQALFAQIHVATRARIELGLALGLRPSRGRLRDSGGFAKRHRITHRFVLSSLAEVDAEVQHWLHVAYSEAV